MAKQTAKEMFRKEALDHLSSPEQLDQLLQVTTGRSWLPMLAIAGALAAALVWSIFGTIPVTVEGKGLLVYPQGVVSFQAPATGQIVTLDVKVDDNVGKHQVLGRINQPELRQRLEQEQARLAEMEARDKKLLALRAQRASLEKQSIEANRLRLHSRIKSTTAMAEAQRAKSEEYFAKQDENLAKLKEVTQKLGQTVEERYEHKRKAYSQGVATETEVLDARRTFFDNRVKLADIELRVHELELRRIEAEDSYQRQIELVADFHAEIEKLDIEASKVDQLDLETVSDSKLRIQEIERNIARYKEELRTKGLIVSEHAGRILEITGARGQIVTQGQRLGAIEIQRPGSELVAVVYFEVSDGKKIKKDMATRISPTTIQRERYGSMIGRVTSVSRFPVTTDAATNVVGNAEVARALTSGGNKIEVFSAIELDPSSPTGDRPYPRYLWTSVKGPEGEITAGTTVVVRTTVETRRPISYVIPLLRRWSGG